MPSLRTKKAGSFHSTVVKLISDKAHPLTQPADLDPLIERIGDASIVMLGEASHGTHEYYTWRTLISKRLITEKQFRFIAVEGDWPDAYQLNRYIKNYPTEASTAVDVLRSFDRWPTWMWANWEIAALGDWLHRYNQHRPASQKIGFYGLDVYSLWDSLDAILKFLHKTDPSAVAAAEKAFHCFEPYKTDDGNAYNYGTALVSAPCEQDVLNLLRDIRKRMPEYGDDYENAFSTEQNALIAVNAEKYYRSMMKGMAESWNVRDSHMFETLQRLMEFHGENAKVIVWEHNTHIGDARATDMADDGMFNIGELARRHFGDSEVVLVGFGSYQGTVTAAEQWGGKMQTMKMADAREESWEAFLNEADRNDKLLIMEDFKHPALMESHVGHRAIGVVYRPDFERYGNYVPSIMPLRYDAFIYLRQTKALHPLHIQPHSHQTPDTYPFGV